MLYIKLFPFSLSPKNLFVDTGMDKTFENVNIFYKQFKNSLKIVFNQAISIQLYNKEFIVDTGMNMDIPQYRYIFKHSFKIVQVKLFNPSSDSFN